MDDLSSAILYAIRALLKPTARTENGPPRIDAAARPRNYSMTKLTNDQIHLATTHAPPPDCSCGYVAVNPEAVTVPPFENSGCTQNDPVAV